MPWQGRNPLDRLDVRRICIVKPSALGDVVQSLPVLAALRQRFPVAHIAWIVNSGLAPLLRPIRLLDAVIEFRRDAFHGRVVRGAAGLLRFLAFLRAQRFDCTIDLQGLLRTGFMSLATRAPRRIGLASAREGARWFCTDVIDDQTGVTAAVDRYWRVAEALGVGNLPKTFPLDLTPDERRWARRAVFGLPRPLLGLNPGTRWPTKQWPAERFALVANAALDSRGSAVLLGGPGEESLTRIIAPRLEVPFVDLCGRMSLRQLAAVLEQCDLVLTNDSGPMHLAAAVGTPTVALFTCTSPARAGPHGSGHEVLQTSVPCRASYCKLCDRMDCMADLTTARVAPVVADRLLALAATSQKAG